MSKHWVFLFVLHVNIDEHTPSIQVSVLRKQKGSILKFIIREIKGNKVGKNVSF